MYGFKRNVIKVSWVVLYIGNQKKKKTEKKKNKVTYIREKTSKSTFDVDIIQKSELSNHC